MKKLLVVSILLFILSIIFRLLHWPASSIMSIISVLLVFIFTIKNTFNNTIVYNISIFEGWVILSWSLFLLFKYLFWYSGPLVFGFTPILLFALLMTMVYGVILFIGTKSISSIIIVVGGLGFTTSFIPAYSIHHFFALNEIINKENNKVNYYSWDKYSWFLYIYGKDQEALEANEKAIEAFHNCKIISSLGTVEEFQLGMLMKRKEAILNHTWIWVGLPRDMNDLFKLDLLTK